MSALICQAATLALVHAETRVDSELRACSALVWEEAQSLLRFPAGVTVQLDVRLIDAAGILADFDSLLERLRFAIYLAAQRSPSPVPDLSAAEVAAGVIVERGNSNSTARLLPPRAGDRIKKEKKTKWDEEEEEEKEFLRKQEERLRVATTAPRRDEVAFAPNLWFDVLGSSVRAAGNDTPVHNVSLQCSHHVALAVLLDLLRSGSARLKCKNKQVYTIELDPRVPINVTLGDASKSVRERFLALVLPGVHATNVFTLQSWADTNLVRRGELNTVWCVSYNGTIQTWPPSAKGYTKDEGRFVATLSMVKPAMKPRAPPAPSTPRLATEVDADPGTLEFMDELGVLYPFPPPTFFERARAAVLRDLEREREARERQRHADSASKEGEEETKKEVNAMLPPPPPPPVHSPRPTQSKKMLAERSLAKDKSIKKIHTFFSPIGKQ